MMTALAQARANTAKWSEGVFAGLDLGSRQHPSHMAIVEIRDDVIWQIISQWWDSAPLDSVIDEAMALGAEHGVDRLCYDDTRGELQVLAERDELPSSWMGVTFTRQSKQRMAARLAMALERGQLKLLPDERQKRQLALVDQMLQAPETDEGHSDCFWSLGLALEAASGKSAPSMGEWYGMLLGWHQRDKPGRPNNDEMSDEERAKRKIRQQSAMWRIGR